MLSTRIRVSPFKGYRVTCFTNEEEEGVGVAPKATWLLETELKEKIGVSLSRGEIWKPYNLSSPVEEGGASLGRGASCPS
jgi:hypothetical protein